jgi:cytochrome c oxidase subunit 4
MPDSLELNPATVFFMIAGIVAGLGFLAAVTVPGFIGAQPQESAAEPPLPAGEHGHPKPAEYVQIAVVLAVVTALEVALYYVESLSKSVVVPLLLIFAFIKFVLVALWYMHLKFDSRLFSSFFAAGIAMAITVYMVVLLTFRVFV